MNNLDYSISLRVKGFSKNEIKMKLFEKGLDETQIDYYLKKSDEIFLNRTLESKRYNPDRKTKSGFKIIILLLSLLLLSFVFFGYARIGLLGLFIFWSLIGYSSFRK
ncbi:hypothetical protein LY08_02711 [Olleya aquimaris]|uniref:Uncharacterized protein n=1 Tax=Olleya aquimaris TaxID=639310 RepID=A0A327R6L3_9FLAO|nr:hypothetical protein LY08_02711 [Olleya aquimaris]